jgi:hypothetical protein
VLIDERGQHLVAQGPIEGQQTSRLRLGELQPWHLTEFRLRATERFGKEITAWL